MSKAIRFAALACALGIADSKVLKWSDNGPRWIPPRETLAYLPSLGMNPPSPTPPPEVEPREGLRARDPTQNTCAYVDGIGSKSGP
jgi:hypothetical protein